MKEEYFGSRMCKKRTSNLPGQNCNNFPDFPGKIGVFQFWPYVSPVPPEHLVSPPTQNLYFE